MIKKSVIIAVFFCFFLTSIVPLQAQTDTKGRGKLYQLMITNMVELQKVIVAMAQSRWDDAGKEIQKQIDFADQVLELYPKQTIDDIRKYKKTARNLKEHAEKFKEYAGESSDKKMHQEFCNVFAECLFCHTTFRD